MHQQPAGKTSLILRAIYIKNNQNPFSHKQNIDISIFIFAILISDNEQCFFFLLDVEEGALLPSPTREKLMPAITKRESESQRGSPKKTATSRHGSPQKGSPQKGSPKKTIKGEFTSM